MTLLHTRSRPLASVHCGLATAIALLLAGTAAAQDFPEPPDSAPFDWTGFYAGVTTGIGQYTVRETDTGRGPAGSWFDPSGLSRVNNGAGFIGGIRVGYNLAFDPIVVGVEADLSVADLSLFADGTDITTTSNIDWLGTVRGRAGVAVSNGPLPAFIYGTGGLAVTQIEHTIGDTSTSFNAGQFGPNSIDGTRTGYVVGAGVEMAVTDNVLVGLEYLYMDFGKTSVNAICVVCFGSSSPGTPFVFDFEDRVQTIRLNLSWKFGG